MKQKQDAPASRHICHELNTVIFDLDGTLLNTLDDLTDSVNHVMKMYGFSVHSREQVRQMVGNGISMLLQRAIPGGQDNPHFADCHVNFKDYYANHMSIKTAPFPGILKLLVTLQAKGYQLAVVSNKFDAAVKSLCREFFSEVIPIAIGESAAIARKPAPDTVYQAIKELDANPSQCIYVGDSEVDIETAKNAGIPSISVTWGFKSPDFLQAHGAMHLVHHTDELLDCINNYHISQ